MGSWSFSVSCQGASMPTQLTFHYPVLSPKLLYIAASFQEPVTFLTDLSGCCVERGGYRGQGWEEGIQEGGCGLAMLTSWW